MSRVASAIALTGGERRELQRIARAGTSERRMVVRALFVLSCRCWEIESGDCRCAQCTRDDCRQVGMLNRLSGARKTFMRLSRQILSLNCAIIITPTSARDRRKAGTTS
jgi:hypothetical protein